jgi:dethiobiotin synthetase
VKIIVVTGTGTGVGKTVTTAALAAGAMRAGQRVAVVKPIQTGELPGAPGDLAEIQRLTGLSDLHEFVRYAEPLAPATAARRLGEPGPAIEDLADSIAELSDRDVVIIEGAGGALVRFNNQDQGICDLAARLGEILAQPAAPEEHRSWTPEVVLVVNAGLGALHNAAVTAAALDVRGFGPQHLVIGDWPAEPGLAERCNLLDLPSYGGAPVGGVLPSGAGRLAAQEFRALAVRSLTPTLGGTLDAPEFIRAHAVPRPDEREIR